MSEEHNDELQRREVCGKTHVSYDAITQSIVDLPTLAVENILDAITGYCADHDLALTDRAIFQISVGVNVKAKNEIGN